MRLYLAAKIGNVFAVGVSERRPTRISTAYIIMACVGQSASIRRVVDGKGEEDVGNNKTDELQPVRH